MTTETSYIPNLSVKHNVTDFSRKFFNSINLNPMENANHASMGVAIYFSLLGLAFIILVTSIYCMCKNCDKYSKAFDELQDAPLNENPKLKNEGLSLLADINNEPLDHNEC